MFVFSILWSIDTSAYTGRVEMKLEQNEPVYRVHVIRRHSVMGEILIDVKFDGAKWVQVDRLPHRFSTFFLNCMGTAIGKTMENIIPVHEGSASKVRC